jgi:LPXTG-site transpeptidase (sortase) family protein
MVLKKSQVKFIFYFAIIFVMSFLLLYSAGLVPESIKPDQGDSLRTLWDKAQKNAIEKQLGQTGIAGEEPSRIVIGKIKVDATISNPNTTNVATLDEYLKKGAVRYPGSGLLGNGTMFIFAHSSDLAVVNNPAYKTFTHIRDLGVGDTIDVYSSSKKYIYQVISVRLVDSKTALVSLNDQENKLILSTCNTLGAPSERYVVEADYLP